MVHYNQIIIDSAYRVKGTPAQFEVKAPHLIHATQFKVKSLAFNNFILNVNTENNVLYIKKFSTSNGNAGVTKIILPVGIFTSPESLVEALNSAELFYIDETLVNNDPLLFDQLQTLPVQRINETPLFKWDALRNRIYIQTIEKVEQTTIYRSPSSSLLGLTYIDVTIDLTVEFTTNPSTYRWVFPMPVDLITYKHVVIKSEALIGDIQTRYFSSNGEYGHVLCQMPITSTGGTHQVYQTNIMKDFRHSHKNTWDFKLETENGSILPLTDQARITIELHFYNQGHQLSD